jgi:multiple sugar transport system substrate-binding protein
MAEMIQDFCGPFTRRALLGAGAGVCAPALLSGCKAGDAHTIRFWAMGREGEVAVELLQGFERENPGVRVRVEQLPWTAAHEKLLTAFAGDATPDVAQVGNTWLPEMAALGAIEPLQDWLAQTPSIAADDHYAGIWRTNQVGGLPVGVPWYVDTRLMFVRRDLLAQVGFKTPPTDWASWLRCMAALKAGPVATPLLLPTNEFEPLMALALQQGDGEELLRDGGRYGNFSGAGFKRALGLYLDIFAKGYAPGITNNQVANLWQEFGRGTFAFYISGPWNIGEFKRRLPPAQQGSWATAVLPGPTGPGVSIAGGSSLALFKRSRVKPLAWKLIEYLSRPAVQLEFYRLTGNLPPRRSTWALPLNGAPLSSDRYARAFADQLERVRPAPAVPEWERIVQEMQLFAARAAHERASVDATARALDVRVDSLLEKRRWMLDHGARI